MLNLNKTQIMSDIIHGSIVYSGIEHAIISTPIFNRLHRISQSSLVFLTFPSNKVKRFEHSVGTMNVTGEIFYNSICNANEDIVASFIKKIREEVKTWRKKIQQNILPKELRNVGAEQILKSNPPECAIYHYYCPANLKDDDKLPYFIAFQAVRIAGLLHDVGHLPYSHILEKSLKKLYTDVKASEKVNADVKQTFLEIMDPFVNGNDEIHEEFGKLLVNSVEQSIIEGMSIQEKNDITYFFIALVFAFAKKILESNFTDNNIYSDMHLIISGVVDADRLDYCSRDSFCAALDTDVFFYKRFVNGYTLIKKVISDDGYEHYFFAPPAKNLNMIHDLIRKRYRIFTGINYHHRVHKHEIILEKIISDLGLRELEQMGQVQDKLDDVLPMEVSSIWRLVKEIRNNNTWLEYQLIQLDDSWLDTLLKHKFFDIYKENYISISKNGNNIQWNMFDELISTTKHYHSLIKRPSDFQLIDKKLYSLFIKEEWMNPEIDDFIKKFKETSYSEYLKETRSFLFNYCIRYLIRSLAVDDMKESFYQTVENELNGSKNDKILNCIVRSAGFSYGLDTIKSPVFWVDDKGNEIHLEQLSTLRNMFLIEEAMTPLFHLYYLPQYDSQNIQKQIDLDNLTTQLAEIMIKILKDFANPQK